MNRRHTARFSAAAVLSSAAVLTAVAVGPDSPAEAAPGGKPAGTAKGAFVYAKKQVPLTYAYATMVDDVEGTRLSGPQKALHILIADAPVPPEARKEVLNCADLVRSGKLKMAVELRYDPVKKETFHATLFSADAAPQGNPLSVTLAGNAALRLQNLKIAVGSVSGVAQTDGPQEWLSVYGEGEKFRYRVEFRAPLEKPHAITATLTGQAAQDSPQAAAVVALFAAIHAKDMDAARRLSLPNPRLEEAYKTMDREEFWKMATQLSPTPDTFRRSLKKVIVRGDYATLLFGEGDRMRAALRDGAWKVFN